MKKSELIALLAHYPDDIEVCVDGYEGGYEPATSVHVEKLGRGDLGEYCGSLDVREDGTPCIVIS